MKRDYLFTVRCKRSVLKGVMSKEHVGWAAFILFDMTRQALSDEQRKAIRKTIFLPSTEFQNSAMSCHGFNGHMTAPLANHRSLEF
jgi:hypothetical protein